MKKQSLGKMLLPLLAVVFFSFGTSLVFAQKTSFSGDWKLNESKSELGDFAQRATRSIKAEQKDDAIVITRTSPGFNGGDPVVSMVTLTYDGKVVESEGFGGSKRKSSAKWSDDGKTLTINSTMNFERDGQSFEIKSEEKWTMQDGMLSVVTNTTSPRGETTTKAMYGK